MASWEDVLKARSLSGVITLFDACERDNERIQRWRWPCLREARQLQGVCACSSFNENWEQSLHGSTSSRATVAHTLALLSVTNLPPSLVLWQLLLFNRNNSIPHNLYKKLRSPEVERESGTCDLRTFNEAVPLSARGCLDDTILGLKELEFPSWNAFCGLQEFRTETYSMLSICWLCLALSRKN